MIKDTLYAQYMKESRLTIVVPSLLQETVSILDEINISSHSHDVQGDIYEELLGSLQQTGKNGQYRTPRHIIKHDGVSYPTTNWRERCVTLLVVLVDFCLMHMNTY